MSRGVSPITTVRSRGHPPRARPRDRRQQRAVLGVGAEAALALREPVADPRARELEPGDPLEVAGHEREAERVRPPAQRRQRLRDPGRQPRRQVRRAELVVELAARGDDVVGASIDRLRRVAARRSAGRARSPRPCGLPPRPERRPATASRARASMPSRIASACSSEARWSSVPSMSQSSRSGGVTARTTRRRRAAGRTPRAAAPCSRRRPSAPSRPASACSAAGSRRPRSGCRRARRGCRRRRCPVERALAVTVKGIPSASAVSCSSSNADRVERRPALDDRPAAEAVPPELLLVEVGLVGRERHVDDDDEVGLERERRRPRARERDLLLRHRERGDVGRRVAGLRHQPRRLVGHVATEAVVHRPRDEPPVRVLDRLAADHRDVADAHQRARVVAVLRADVDVQVLELRRLLALLAVEQVDRPLADHARDRPVARQRPRAAGRRARPCPSRRPR